MVMRDGCLGDEGVNIMVGFYGSGENFMVAPFVQFGAMADFPRCREGRPK